MEDWEAHLRNLPREKQVQYYQDCLGTYVINERGGHAPAMLQNLPYIRWLEDLFNFSPEELEKLQRRVRKNVVTIEYFVRDSLNGED